jgi:enoyl-CoA hydratase
MSNGFIVEEHGNAIVIRFNRPEIRSPLSIDVLDRLSGMLDELQRRPEIDRLVFTGTGNVFASGADLREIAAVDPLGSRDFALRGQRLMSRIGGMQMTTIAAINGICFGGALDLALACRVRIASPDALFAHPGADLGIMTGWGGTQRLPRLVGQAVAAEMFFTAKRVTADEAVRIGLVDQLSGNVLERSLDRQLDLSAQPNCNR